MKMNIPTVKWLVFLALIKNICCNKVNPFSLEKPYLTAVEGSCVEIRCKPGNAVSYSAGAHWFWMKDANWTEKTGFIPARAYCSDMETCSAKTGLKTRIQYIVPPPESGSQYKPENICNILICNLNKTDSGKYQFRYISGESDGADKWATKHGVNLKVTENPCPITFNRSASVMQDDRVTLICSTLPSCNRPEIDTVNQLISTLSISETSQSITISFTANWSYDGFVFSCQTPENTDKYLIKNATLTVEYAPRDVSVKPNQNTVTEGASLTLMCSARGQPKVTFSWFKDDKNMNRLEAEITFNSIQDSDSGRYHCKATNKHGVQNSTELTITVLYAPEVQIKEPIRESRVVEGHNVSLECIVIRSNPQPYEYTWLKDGKEVKKGNILLISGVKSEDSGDYSCVANNSVGSGKSNFHHLDVKYKPRSNIAINGLNDNRVKIHSSITFLCNTLANPSPEYYSWYHYKQSDPSNWTPITSEQASLTFTSIKRSDEACYLCNATNLIGKGEMSEPRCIQVLFPPTNLMLSLPTKVREGQPVRFTCSAESSPSARFELKRSSSQNPQFSKSADKENTFTNTFNATSASAGSYFCTASNSEGENRSAERTLEVEYSPKDVRVKAPSVLEVKENEPLSLICEGHSNPSITSFTWMKKTGYKELKVDTKKNYNVKAASLSDEGLYRCEAKNAIGSGKSQHVEVKIKYGPKHITIRRGKEQQLPDGWRSVTLSCSTQSYPPAKYVWFNKTTNKEVSKGQDIKVMSYQPGELYCVAENDLGHKPSDPIRPFDGRIRIMMKILLSCFAVLVILLLFFLYRYKKNKSNQRTSNAWPCCGFLVWWNGSRRRNRMNETILTEPFRSRDDLLTEGPHRPKAQRPYRQPRPDTTPLSNINTIYATVNQPQGQQAPSGQTPAGQQRGNMEDDFLNYASLHFEKKKKMEDNAIYSRACKPKPSEEDSVYSKVCKPKPSKEIEQQKVKDYENVSPVKPTKPSYSYDSDTSEDEVEVNYSQVNFRQKNDHQTDSSSSEDDAQYS